MYLRYGMLGEKNDEETDSKQLIPSLIMKIKGCDFLRTATNSFLRIHSLYNRSNFAGITGEQLRAFHSMPVGGTQLVSAPMLYPLASSWRLA
jgi:hypothetical protein